MLNSSDCTFCWLASLGSRVHQFLHQYCEEYTIFGFGVQILNACHKTKTGWLFGFSVSKDPFLVLKRVVCNNVLIDSFMGKHKYIHASNKQKAIVSALSKYNKLMQYQYPNCGAAVARLSWRWGAALQTPDSRHRSGGHRVKRRALSGFATFLSLLLSKVTKKVAKITKEIQKIYIPPTVLVKVYHYTTIPIHLMTDHAYGLQSRRETSRFDKLCSLTASSGDISKLSTVSRRHVDMDTFFILNWFLGPFNWVGWESVMIKESCSIVETKTMLFLLREVCQCHCVSVMNECSWIRINSNLLKHELVSLSQCYLLQLAAN